MTEQTYTFRAHARQSGKTSDGRYPWVRGGRRDDRWIDGGIIADPIDVTAHDIETAPPDDLEALAAGRWLPGVTTHTTFDTFGRRVVRVSSTPCITTVGA